MTTFDTMAISLRTTPFQEAHQIVSFYSAEHGELRAIAKGVKKHTSKLTGACEALTLNHVFLSRGKSLHTVCNYDRVESFSFLRADLERLAVGTVCTEVVRLLGRENDPDSHVVYALLASTLKGLDNPNVSWVYSSVEFHVEMLTLAGYRPSFTHCVTCGEAFVMEEKPYFPFTLALGGFLCEPCVRHQSGTLNKVNVSTQTMQLLTRPEDVSLYANAEKAHRFLAYYWGHRLERPLKSFEFLFQLMQSAVC